MKEKAWYVVYGGLPFIVIVGFGYLMEFLTK